MVSAELGIGTLKGRVARGLGLLDAVKLVRTMVEFDRTIAKRTRCGAPWPSGCAGNCSSTLLTRC